MVASQMLPVQFTTITREKMKKNRNWEGNKMERKRIGEESKGRGGGMGVEDLIWRVVYMYMFMQVSH